MTNQMSKPSTRTARLAGLLYLLLIPLGFFGMAYIPEVLVIPGDIATTMQNLVDSESLFRLSLASGFLMNLVMIALVLVLYQLFSPVSKPLATFMVVFGLLGVGIAMLNEVNSFAALMLSHLHAGAVFAVEQTQYLVELFLEMREFGVYIAGIFWGLWLLPLGYLLFRYDLLARIVGISLIIAGVGYVIDSFVLFLAPHYLVPISDYAFVGEVMFTLWLLFKGPNVEEQTQSTLTLAYE